MSGVNKSVLLETHLFKLLNQAQLQRVVDSTRPVHLCAGQMLFTKGQQANSFYLVVTGYIRLFRSSRDGNEKIIEIVRSGGIFAEAVMFMAQPHYPVNAAAVGDSLLYCFSNKVYLELLCQSQELCFALFGDLCIRLHQLLNEIDRLSLQNARYRVVQYLNDLRSGSDTKVINLDIGKKTIASRLSITPETLSRIFRELVDDGIISISGKRIDIYAPERLKL